MDQPGLSIMLRVRGSFVDKAFGLCVRPELLKNKDILGMLFWPTQGLAGRIHESLVAYKKPCWLVDCAMKASKTNLSKPELVVKRGCRHFVLALLFCGHQRHPNPLIHGYSSPWTIFKSGTESYRNGEGGRIGIAPSAHELAGYP